MPRPRQESKIQIPPRISGFIPLGYYSKETEPIKMNLEEYEVIRLLDYENLSQEQAAIIMEISRPTLTRIYERARKKIAKTLVESHKLVLEGGTAIFDRGWFECQNCKSFFNNYSETEPEVCPLCSKGNIIKIS